MSKTAKAGVKKDRTVSTSVLKDLSNEQLADIKSTRDFLEEIGYDEGIGANIYPTKWENESGSDSISIPHWDLSDKGVAVAAALDDYDGSFPTNIVHACGGESSPILLVGKMIGNIKRLAGSMTRAVFEKNGSIKYIAGKDSEEITILGVKHEYAYRNYEGVTATNPNAYFRKAIKNLEVVVQTIEFSAAARDAMGEIIAGKVTPGVIRQTWFSEDSLAKLVESFNQGRDPKEQVKTMSWISATLIEPDLKGSTVLARWNQRASNLSGTKVLGYEAKDCWAYRREMQILSVLTKADVTRVTSALVKPPLPESAARRR